MCSFSTHLSLCRLASASVFFLSSSKRFCFSASICGQERALDLTTNDYEDKICHSHCLARHIFLLSKCHWQENEESCMQWVYTLPQSDKLVDLQQAHLRIFPLPCWASKTQNKNELPGLKK